MWKKIALIFLGIYGIHYIITYPELVTIKDLKEKKSGSYRVLTELDSHGREPPWESKIGYQIQKNNNSIFIEKGYCFEKIYNDNDNMVSRHSCSGWGYVWVQKISNAKDTTEKYKLVKFNEKQKWQKIIDFPSQLDSSYTIESGKKISPSVIEESYTLKIKKRGGLFSNQLYIRTNVRSDKYEYYK